MSLTASSYTVLDDLASRLAAESVFAKAGSDEGLIPAYSLLTEMVSHLAGQPDLLRPISALRARLDALLDAASPLDPTAEAELKSVAAWLPGALAAAREGTPVLPPGSPSGKVHAAAAAPTNTDAANTVDEVLQLDLAENRELLGEFQVEALDHLQQIEAALLVLDAKPDDRDALNGLFRSFHTLKGVSGFLHLRPMHKLAHEVESLLDLARTEKLRLTPAIITQILLSRDAIQEMVSQVTIALEQGRPPEKIVPVSKLIAAVRSLAGGAPAAENATTTAPVAPPVPPAKPTETPYAAPKPELSPPPTSNPTATSTSPSPIQAVAVSQTAPTATPPPSASPPPTSPREPAGATNSSTRGSGLSSSVRVNTEKLDSLMDVVGELVIVQSQLLESARAAETAAGSALSRNLAQLGRITKELQHTSMSLRMVPIKPTFQRMERLVRDLSREFGKPCVLELKGEETEIDRTVAEEIVDPLVHMVRNSLDHGLETPDARLAAGKSEQGHVRLAAYHEGSNLVIELSDDGRGINRAKVLAKARAQGLVPEGVTPPPDEIYNLIFLPGFSTAEKVTAVSGRGVGMDVVKRNIERLRGHIQIETEEGRGTTFRIRLPLTTAIIDGLLIRVGQERFILPTIAVQVALRPTREMLSTVQGRGEVLDHRGKILPLQRLHRRFGISGAIEDPTAGIVVVIDQGRRTYGLLVDELLNKQEVVIKNLGALLQNRPGVAGGAILGDGTVALILDPASLGEN